MQTVHQDFIEILREKLAQRCQRNSGYSLRAFARDLEISPQRLSHILNGRHGISPAAAKNLSIKLGMSEAEANFFCALVEKKHGRSAVVKEEAKKKLNEIKTAYKDLSLDHFKIIADWYHFAIMELTLIEGFVSDTRWIAKTLGISLADAKAAIQRLIKLEMLEIDKKGALKLTGDFFASNSSGISSQALKQFHQQLLNKALIASEFQTSAERDFSSTILAVAEKDLPYAKKRLRDFRESFDKEFSASKKKTKVYCLGIQLFNLQEKL